MTDREKIEKLRKVLRVILGNVDFTRGCCAINSMVGAALPVEAIEDARQALEETEPERVDPVVKSMSHPPGCDCDICIPF